MVQTLYDNSGYPIAYIDEDGISIYLYNGVAVGWLSEDSIYSYNGKHLGFFMDGWVIDHSGNRVFFTEKSQGGPAKPARAARPARGAREARPARGARESRPARPARSSSWSSLSGDSFFDQ
jgi:hypothetical protein